MKKIMIILFCVLLVVILMFWIIKSRTNNKLDDTIVGSWQIETPPSDPNSLENEKHIISFDDDKNFYFENEILGKYENGIIVLNDTFNDEKITMIKYSKVDGNYYLENVIHKENGVFFVDLNVSSIMTKIDNN